MYQCHTGRNKGWKTFVSGLFGKHCRGLQTTHISIQKEHPYWSVLTVWFHHLLVHKLGVIRTLFHLADPICSDEDAKDSERKHLKSVLGACGYQSWTFEKALKKSKSRTLDSNSNRTQGVTRDDTTLLIVEQHCLWFSLSGQRMRGNLQGKLTRLSVNACTNTDLQARLAEGT